MQTGTFIPVQDRIGILDRKLRIVSENTSCLEDWIKWATRSIESVYGFEFQGDSLIIARENVLFTFIENMYMKFECVPDAKLLKKNSQYYCMEYMANGCIYIFYSLRKKITSISTNQSIC